MDDEESLLDMMDSFKDMFNKSIVSGNFQTPNDSNMVQLDKSDNKDSFNRSINMIDPNEQQEIGNETNEAFKYSKNGDEFDSSNQYGH